MHTYVYVYVLVKANRWPLECSSACACRFFGIISRKEAEGKLRGQRDGTFLIRVAESRFGYSLSLSYKGRVKHFMVDKTDDGQYLVVGNDRLHPSLNELVDYYSRHSVTEAGDKLLHACEDSGPRHDLTELMN